VESKRSRRRRLKAARPRRLMPTDLKGHCFNCFSMTHFAAQCRQRTRCFRCRALGHRSAACPVLFGGGGVNFRKTVGQRPLAQTMVWRAKGQSKVWRNIAAAPLAVDSVVAGTSATAPVVLSTPHNLKPVVEVVALVVAGTTAPSSGAGLGKDSANSRRRRWPRKRRTSAREHRDLPLNSVPSVGQVQASPMSSSFSPSSFPCILDWSIQLTRAEEDLTNAVVITVISDRSDVTTTDVVALIVPQLDVEVASLALRCSSPSSFFLVLPNVEMVTTVVERRPLLRVASFSIACKRWSRFMGSVGGILPHFVNFELRGIPVHAWETVTAAQLLSPFAWVHHIHPAIVELEDLTIFRCLAWVRDLDSISESRDLWIVELPMVSDEVPLGKKTRVYPISFHYTLAVEVPESSFDDPAQQPFQDEGPDDHSRRRRRDRSRSWSRSGSRSPWAEGVDGRAEQGGDDTGERRCWPAHERLGSVLDAYVCTSRGTVASSPGASIGTGPFDGECRNPCDGPTAVQVLPPMPPTASSTEKQQLLQPTVNLLEGSPEALSIDVNPSVASPTLERFFNSAGRVENEGVGGLISGTS
jgi:hypothetical protein